MFFLTFAPSVLDVDFPSSAIPRSQILNAPFVSGVQKQLSRYFIEFEELQLLGKGAFGAVIKVGFNFKSKEAGCDLFDVHFVPYTLFFLHPQVQNKLDGCYYAVKRIQVNPTSKQFRRIKGEVTLLSRLNHENIVRYYNAWIEKHETPSTGVLSSTDSSEPQSPADRRPQCKQPRHRLNELGIPDNVEDIAPPPVLSSSVEWSTSIERSSSAKCGRHQSSDEEDDDDEEDVDVFGASFMSVCFLAAVSSARLLPAQILETSLFLLLGRQIVTGVTSSLTTVMKAQMRCRRFEYSHFIIYSPVCQCHSCNQQMVFPLTG